jgi:glycosyltransferase involved in cell wall biosynthesis
MPGSCGSPKLSIVIPTYNRHEMLRQALESLAGQDVPPGEFEVIVADDGSSDGTGDMVRALSGELPLRYHFQEDLGFRVAAARNAGARLATAPVLAFLDAGTVPGPGFVRGHLAAHAGARPERGRAVIGYCYGYQPFDEPDWAAGELASLGPAGALQRHADDPGFLDIRHGVFARAGFDAGRLTAPWFVAWSMNISVTAGTFWQVGGFDEAFRSWGVEDTELAYRIFRHGAAFQISRDAWAVELPHSRRRAGNRQSMLRNSRYFVRKRPDPEVEIAGDALKYADLWLVEDGTSALRSWAARARELDVLPELESAARQIAPGARVAIFGCGGQVPADLPPSVLIDFDPQLLAAALAGGRHTGYHALGLRTPLATGSADEVIITSRLRGLWDRWGEVLTAEAHRVGGRVHGPRAGCP